MEGARVEASVDETLLVRPVLGDAESRETSEGVRALMERALEPTEVEAAIAAAQASLVPRSSTDEETAEVAKARLNHQAAIAIAVGMVLTAVIISMTIIYLARRRSAGGTRTIMRKSHDVPLQPGLDSTKSWKSLVPGYLRSKKGIGGRDKTKDHLVHLGAMTQAPTVACL